MSWQNPDLEAYHSISASPEGAEDALGVIESLYLQLKSHPNKYYPLGWPGLKEESKINLLQELFQL